MKNLEKIYKLLNEIIDEEDLDINEVIDHMVMLNDFKGGHKMLSTKQIKMPENWLEQLTEAKVQHDKHGNVSEVFILPLSWCADFNEKRDACDHELYEHFEKKYIWGATILFGPTDEPVAGGNWLK